MSERWSRLIERLIRWLVVKYMPLYHIKRKPIRVKSDKELIDDVIIKALGIKKGDTQ